jgi:L-lactate dehydrogenase complex protein LldG
VNAIFAVAENGAVWITNDEMRIRALPFICEHLAVVINKKDIVNNMQEAYERIGNNAYDFGVFIAGPSKTADIEQSLVLGAHGPKTMTVFIKE